MQLAYLGALLVSLAGLGFADWRHRLVLFYDLRRALKTLGTALAVFVVWDLLGIASGIFLAGDSRYATGIFLMPQFPLEELFFLALLVYLPLILWQGLRRWR